MEFTKKNLTEALKTKASDKKTFSKKPQNVIVSETQLERLIENINTTKKK